MERYKVTRAFVKWKGQFYRKGELLPPEFTERDRMHNAFTNRVSRIELPDEPPEVEFTQEPPPVIGEELPAELMFEAASEKAAEFVPEPESEPAPEIEGDKPEGEEAPDALGRSSSKKKGTEKSK